MNILITGGCGFIGSNLAKTLAKNKDNYIKIIDNIHPQIHKNFNEFKFFKDYKNISLFKKDILDISVSDLYNIDIIYHMVAETGTGQSMYEIDRYVNTNVYGFSKLLQIIIDNKLPIKKIILPSSRSVYGEGDYYCSYCNKKYSGEQRSNENMKNNNFDIYCSICNNIMSPIPTKEDSKLNPLSIYATTKLIQELLLKNFSYYTNINYLIFRLQNVYGVGQSLHNPYTGLLSVFINNLKQNKSIEIYEDGKESRDFIYVDDVVKTIIDLSLSDLKNEIVNIGNSQNISIENIANILINIVGKGDYYISNKYRIGDVRHSIGDITKLKSIHSTNYLTIEDGISKLVSNIFNKN